MAKKLGKTFVEVVTFLMEGQAIYRQSWPNCQRISRRPDTLIPAIDMRDYDGKVNYWVPLQEDLFATDWKLHADQF